MPVPETLPELKPWKGLKSVGVVTSICVRDGKETVERHYYISSLPVGVTVRSRSPQPLGNRECLPLESRCEVPRRRIPHPREDPAGELRLAESLHGVTAEAAFRPNQPYRETPLLRLE
jgi:hypothetical protein